MKVALEFPDEKAAFVLELLHSLPYVKTKALDETKYLLQSPANAAALLAAIERTRNGQVVEHELIEA